MKKTLRSLKLACLAAVSMLVVSCGGGADYRNLLPADSFMTMSVNPASLLQKSDAGDIGQHPLFIRLKAELDKAEGITAEQLDAVHSPIGLSLGGETPEEIAVSILAELLMIRYGKTKSDL